MNIQEQLWQLRDENYALFHAKLIPTVPVNTIIGVRVPELRKLAKKYIKEDAIVQFLVSLPHTYYDENILHALLLSELKEFHACIERINSFLPYIDNWAVCDILSPKILLKHRDELLQNIHQWLSSKEVYSCRFGLGMLMRCYLDEYFRPEYLELPLSITPDDYYINMMIAWFYATALAKQWDHTVVYLQKHRLPEWIHRKTIQKAKESFRITPEQKIYLRSLL